MNTLKKVVVGGSTTSLPLSKLIEWFTRRFPLTKKIRRDVPSHSWAAGYSEELDAVIVLEATWYGYRPTEWSRWLKKRKITDAWYNTECDMQRSVHWAGKQFGASYDYKAFFIFVLKYLRFLITLKWVKHPSDTPGAMHCSEAKTRFLQQEGYLNTVQADGVTPLNFRHLVQGVSDFEEVTDQVISGKWWTA